MKKNLLSTLIAFIGFAVNAQSYIGLSTDNYKGVHGVIKNPASIADSPYKLDVNLVGTSALLNNDYYGFDFFELLNEDYDLDEDAAKFRDPNNSILSNIDILGPSVLFNLNEKSSLAVHTRARTFLNLNRIEGSQFDDLSDTFDDGFDENQDFFFNENSAYGTINSWAEIGVTYALSLIHI